jgi:hypothetical protein
LTVEIGVPDVTTSDARNDVNGDVIPDDDDNPDRAVTPNPREKADVNATLAPSLSAADRCDRCGAQAYIRARLTGGGELLFCAHHGRQHLPELQARASEIQDETDRLTAEDLLG